MRIAPLARAPAARIWCTSYRLHKHTPTSRRALTINNARTMVGSSMDTPSLRSFYPSLGELCICFRLGPLLASPRYCTFLRAWSRLPLLAGAELVLKHHCVPGGGCVLTSTCSSLTVSPHIHASCAGAVLRSRQTTVFTDSRYSTTSSIPTIYFTHRQVSNRPT